MLSLSLCKKEKKRKVLFLKLVLYADRSDLGKQDILMLQVNEGLGGTTPSRMQKKVGSSAQVEGPDKEQIIGRRQSMRAGLQVGVCDGKACGNSFLIASIFKVVAERKAGARVGRGLRPHELVLEEIEQTGECVCQLVSSLP